MFLTAENALLGADDMVVCIGNKNKHGLVLNKEVAPIISTARNMHTHRLIAMVVQNGGTDCSWHASCCDTLSKVICKI